MTTLADALRELQAKWQDEFAHGSESGSVMQMCIDDLEPLIAAAERSEQGQERTLTAEQAEKIDAIFERHKTDVFDSFHAADELSAYLWGGVGYPQGILAAAPREERCCDTGNFGVPHDCQKKQAPQVCECPMCEFHRAALKGAPRP